MLDLLSIYASACAAIVASIFLIYLLYRFVENKWPDIYFSTTDKSSAILAMNPLWFFMFRFLPIYIITTILFSFLKEDAFSLQERLFAGAIVGVTHAILTDGIASVKILRKSKSIHHYSNRSAQIVTHVISGVLVIVLAIFGGYTSSFLFLQNFVPTMQGVIDNMWSSLMIAAFLFAFSRIPKIINKWTAIGDVYNISRKKVDSKIFDEIRKQSILQNANSKLIEAIAIVENVQRPKWIRRLEWVKSFFISEGSYGVMQVQSDKYVSDLESVKLAVNKYFKDSNSSRYDDKSLENFIML